MAFVEVLFLFASAPTYKILDIIYTSHCKQIIYPMYCLFIAHPLQTLTIACAAVEIYWYTGYDSLMVGFNTNMRNKIINPTNWYQMQLDDNHRNNGAYRVQVRRKAWKSHEPNAFWTGRGHTSDWCLIVFNHFKTPLFEEFAFANE